MDRKISTAILFAQIARDCGYKDNEAFRLIHVLMSALDVFKTFSEYKAVNEEQLDEIYSAVQSLRDKMKGGVDYD